MEPAVVLTSRAGSISLEVMSPDERSEPGPRNSEIAKRWTDIVGPIPEATTFRVFAEQTLRKGREYDDEYLNVELRGANSPEKAEVARNIKTMMEGFEGISTAWAHVNYGQDELELSLKPRAAELGLTQALLPSRSARPFTARKHSVCSGASTTSA